MAKVDWETLKVRYCLHVKDDVALEAQVVFPADQLPDQAPRVLAHRCSRGLECAMDERGTCIWAGSNPGYDPFAEK